MACSLVSIYFDSPHLAFNKIKLYKTLDYWPRDILNFDFLEKALGTVSPPHFVYDFSRKCFSCYILVTNQIKFLIFEILANLCMAVVCFPVVKS